MNKLLFSIGDTHGCLKATKNILAQIDKDRNGQPAKIIFLGDYTDRGPNSAELVQHLIDLRYKSNPLDIEYVFIRGNHDVMLMNAVKNLDSGLWMYNGGVSTLDSYHKTSYNMDNHVDLFFKHTKWYHQEGQFIFVHAGLDPDESLDNQRSYTMIWDRIWNNYDGKYFNNVFVIHGHTPVEKPDLHSNQLNIDTGCCFGLTHQKYFPLGLTAVRIDSRTDFKFFHAKEE